MGIFDFFTGGDSTPTASSDATGSYLGNLVDPMTTPQYLKARQQEAALGFFTGLAAGSGPSRLPVPFGSAVASGAQGLMGALNNLSDNSLKSAQTGNAIVDTKLKGADIVFKDLQGQQLKQQIGLLGNAARLQQEYYQNGGVYGAPGTPGGTPGKSALALSSTTADTSMEPEQRALLDTIAGPESAGAYNVRYTPKGGVPFDSYASHPGIYEEGPAGPSSAAGRYQFVRSTFLPIQQQLGLPDFSPISQDKAGWANAATEYQRTTGRDLLADLKAGRTQDVGRALRGQWGTLAGAMPNYAANLAKYNSPAVANAAPGTVTIAANGGSGSSNDNKAQVGADNDNRPMGSRTMSNGISAVPPGTKFNSQGVPYSSAPIGGVPAGTAGAGPVITQADAARMNAAARAQAMGPTQIGAAGEYGAGQTPRMPMPIMPTDATFGRGMVAPPGAGQVTPAPPGLMAMAAPQQAVQGPQPGPGGLMGAAANGAVPAPQPAPQVPQQMAQVQPPQVMMPQPTPQTMAQAPLNQGQPFLPPGITIERVLKAQQLASAYEFAKVPVPPDVKQLAEYPLAAALKAQEAFSAQQAEAHFAGQKAGNTKAAEAPYVPPQVYTVQTPDGLKKVLMTQAQVNQYTQTGQLPTRPGAQEGERVIDPLKTYDLSPQVGQGPGQNAPRVITPGQGSAYYFVNPPLSAQDPIRTIGGNVKDLEAEWNKTNVKMADAQQGIQQSRQLLNTMADIFHNYEGGAFAQGLSENVAKLKALGINLSNVNDPADMQQILKDNFARSLATMKATGLTRWTQMELKSTSENFANPNLQPAASFAILTQDMGTVNQADALTQAWSLARRDGWSDPNSFAQKWYNQPENSLQNFVDRAKAQVGPFKGMTPEQKTKMMPQTADGPNGMMIHQNGEWRPL